MATKKSTKKSNFTVVTGGRGNRYRHRYRLDRTGMVSVSTEGRLQRTFGRYIPKGEVFHVLHDLYRQGYGSTEVRTYGLNSGSRQMHVAKRADDGSLVVGCHTFSPKAVSKLARWTGADIESR